MVWKYWLTILFLECFIMFYHYVCIIVECTMLYHVLWCNDMFWFLINLDVGMRLYWDVKVGLPKTSKNCQLDRLANSLQSFRGPLMSTGRWTIPTLHWFSLSSSEHGNSRHRQVRQCRTSPWDSNNEVHPFFGALWRFSVLRHLPWN